MQWVHQQSRTMSAVGLLRRLACVTRRFTSVAWACACPACWAERLAELALMLASSMLERLG